MGRSNEMVMRLVNVNDYEYQAEKILTKDVFDYFAAGANDEQALSRNREAFNNILLIPRILRDTSIVTTETTFFGHELAMPIMVAPMAFHLAAHDSGEIGTMHAANHARVGMISSTMSTISLEEIAKASTTLRWFQLYVYKDRNITRQLVARAEAAGFTAIVLTVDAPIMGKRERDIRNEFKLPAHLRAMNFADDGAHVVTSDNDGSQVKNYTDNKFDRSFTWKDLEWLRSITTLPIILKGVMHKDDALLAAQAGVDAIVVSNHGGRQLDCAPASIEVLPAIVEAVNKRIPILIDGGFRRGSDIFKALALGADMVLIGRPILWALALNGETGIREILKIYETELIETMTLCGCRNISEIRLMGNDIIKKI